MLSKAQYAGQLRAIIRRLNAEVDELLEGMWNPDFCASQADLFALDRIEETIKHIRSVAGRGIVDALRSPTPQDQGGMDAE